MSGDLIRREDAIDAIVRQTNFDNVDGIRYECRRNYEKDNGWLGGLKDALNAVADIPSAEPERKKGEWIDGKPYVNSHWRVCSVCHECAPESSGGYNFCPHCGADMRGDR